MKEKLADYSESEIRNMTYQELMEVLKNSTESNERLLNSRLDKGV